MCSSDLKHFLESCRASNCMVWAGKKQAVSSPTLHRVDQLIILNALLLVGGSPDDQGRNLRFGTILEVKASLDHHGFTLAKRILGSWKKPDDFGMGW